MMIEEITEPQKVDEAIASSIRPATLQERFAAFFTDSLINLCLLGGWALFLQVLLHGDLTRRFSFQGSNLTLFLTTGAGLHFLYFLFFEGVLMATPGKMLGGLSIQKKKGGTPSLSSVLLRNLLRVIDYPLVLITGIGLMEATESHQRLGDILSCTVVTREVHFDGRRIDPETVSYGGATRRSLSFLLDLILLLSFGYGLLLSIPVEKELPSLIGPYGIPLALLLAVTLSESLFQTTCGKALLGLKVIQEDGRPGQFSTLLVRNFFRLFDTNPIGYLCTALSTRNQRPGDIIAGTIVVRHRQGLRGWLGIPFLLALTTLTLSLGLHNPEGFLKKGYGIRIGSWWIDSAPSSLPKSLQKLIPNRMFRKSN